MIPAKPIRAVAQSDSWRKQAAFEQAVEDADYDTQSVIDAMIADVAKHFVRSGHVASMVTAKNQAAAVIAALVAKGEFDRLLAGTVRRDEG